MNKAQRTQAILLKQARQLFWTRGFSNVSLRDISGAAGVDVALISRYFEGKRGLFDETIKTAYDWPDLFIGSKQDMINGFIALFNAPIEQPEEPSEIQMILANIHDDIVGDAMRELFHDRLHSQIIKKIKTESNAALLTTVLFGYAIAQKSLKINGIPKKGSPKIEKQLRHLMHAALSYED